MLRLSRFVFFLYLLSFYFGIVDQFYIIFNVFCYLYDVECIFIELNLQEEELKEIIATARDMELRWGHLFDMIIINNDTQRAYQQLLNEINSLEREPQWVPANWLKQT